MNNYPYIDCLKLTSYLRRTDNVGRIHTAPHPFDFNSLRCESYDTIQRVIETEQRAIARLVNEIGLGATWRGSNVYSDHFVPQGKAAVELNLDDCGSHLAAVFRADGECRFKGAAMGDSIVIVLPGSLTAEGIREIVADNELWCQRFKDAVNARAAQIAASNTPWAISRPVTITRQYGMRPALLRYERRLLRAMLAWHAARSATNTTSASQAA